MNVASAVVVAVLICSYYGMSNACTKICGNYWEGVNIHTYGALNAPQNGELWKDQCFQLTGRHATRDGYYWEEIYYGTVRGWVASQYCYKTSC